MVIILIYISSVRWSEIQRNLLYIKVNKMKKSWMQCSEETPVAQQHCVIQSCNPSVTVRSLIHIFNLIWHSHNRSFGGKVVMPVSVWSLIVGCWLFFFLFFFVAPYSIHFNNNYHDGLNQARASNFGTSPCGLLVDFWAHIYSDLTVWTHMLKIMLHHGEEEKKLYIKKVTIQTTMCKKPCVSFKKISKEDTCVCRPALYCMSIFI